MSLSITACQPEPPEIPKPLPVIEPVQMPPPPPLPTPAQIAAAEAETKRLADEAAKAEQAAAAAKAAEARKRSRVVATPAKRPSYTKGNRTPGTPAVVKQEEPVKPREARFNMTQNGKRMTAEDFDAWMKSQGIRMVPPKPVEPKPDENK